MCVCALSIVYQVPMFVGLYQVTFHSDYHGSIIFAYPVIR